jgi:hypothetical protein
LLLIRNLRGTVWPQPSPFASKDGASSRVRLDSDGISG